MGVLAVNASEFPPRSKRARLVAPESSTASAPWDASAHETPESRTDPTPVRETVYPLNAFFRPSQIGPRASVHAAAKIDCKPTASVCTSRTFCVVGAAGDQSTTTFLTVTSGTTTGVWARSVPRGARHH